MYKVKSKTKISEVVTLDEAMKLAKEMNELVTIEGDAVEIIGLLGVDAVHEGKCPDGSEYIWKKRRK